MAKVDKRALSARPRGHARPRRNDRTNDKGGLMTETTRPTPARRRGRSDRRGSTPSWPGPSPSNSGSMLFTLVEPHRGHEVAYNRWYERDHFYAGCMIGPYQFAGKRFVATAAMKELRDPDSSEVTGEPDRGTYLGVYWVLDGYHDVEPLGRRPGRGPPQSGPDVQRARPHPHPALPLRLGARNATSTAFPPSWPSTTPRPVWWRSSPSGPTTSSRGLRGLERQEHLPHCSRGRPPAWSSRRDPCPAHGRTR